MSAPETEQFFQTHRWCEWSRLDIVALALQEGDPGGGGEDHKGSNGEQGVGLDLLEHIQPLGQLKEGCHSKAQHGQTAVDDLGGQAIKGLDLCRAAGEGSSRRRY